MMENTRDGLCRRQCAKALAGMRYAPAVPALRAILDSYPPPLPDSFEVWDRHQFENALLQLTGTWGKAGKDVRLLIEPRQRVFLARSGDEWFPRLLRSLFGIPAPAQPERATRINLYIENVSSGGLSVMAYLYGRFTVNGRQEARRSLFTGWFGQSYLGINHVWHFKTDVPDVLLMPAWNRIAYETQGTVSNEITIFVWTPGLAMLVGWVVALASLAAALVGVAGVCRVGRWRPGLGAWKGEAATAIVVSVLPAMVLVAGLLLLPQARWVEHIAAAAVVLLGYKLARWRSMRWRAALAVALLQRPLAIGIVLLAGVP